MEGRAMRTRVVVAVVILLMTGWAFTQSSGYPTAKVSFDDFKGLVTAVEAHRAERLIDFDTFLRMSKDPGVVILDSRSEYRFNRLHLKGAEHLGFSDFTQDSLGEVIPSFETTVLIYCNNNFEGNQQDFMSKVATPMTLQSGALANQLAGQEKPLMMALNIPTYVNLYGYGYRNVYELHELVDVNDARATFEGSMVKKRKGVITILSNDAP